MEEELDPTQAAREMLGQPEPEDQLEAPALGATETAELPIAEAEQVQEPESQTQLATAEQVTKDELLEMLQSATPEERQQILNEAREQALAARVGEAITPYRESLQQRIDAGELSIEAANELLESKTEAMMARIEREDAVATAQATAQKAAQDAFFSQVTSEFPGADVETLKLLAGQGVDPNQLRTIAARQSETVKKATETAVAKYVAAKGKDLETFVPGASDASRPMGEDVLDENSSLGELLGIYKGKRGN